MASLTRVAIAGNTDSYYMGVDATLQAGAITADTGAGGSTWYNPAGLAQAHASALDASVSAYSVRLGGHPDFDSATEGSQVTRLTAIDLRVVPAALSFVRRIGDLGVGLGVFVPTVQSLQMRTLVTSDPDGSVGVPHFGIDAIEHSLDYHAGLAVGAQVAPRVRVGGSLFVNYKSSLSIAAAGISYRLPAARQLSAMSHETVDWQQVGAQLVLGVQLQLSPLWNFGSVLRLPSLRLYEDHQQVSMQTWVAGGNPPEAAHQMTFQERAGLSSTMMLPARFHVGVSRKLEAGRVALDLNYQTPFHNDRMGLSWEPTFNARLGAQQAVGDEFTLGGGLFTDHSPTRFTGSVGESDIDFYGVTAALNWGSSYEVRPVGSPTESTSLLTFGTTLALSYAAGFGNVARGEITLGGPSGARLDVFSEPVVAHEITLHLSSSLSK